MPDRNSYLQPKHSTCRLLTWCISSIKVMLKIELASEISLLS
nr:unnamed protein product [Callosobruchus analis]